MREYIELAKKVRLNAQVKTSGFQVGAVLLSSDGRIFTGCNIENDGIQSICAERVAFVKALSDGVTDFKSILVVGALCGNDDFPECVPCGYCRQFMSEYVDKDFKIYTLSGNNTKEYSIDDLLPNHFSL